MKAPSGDVIPAQNHGTVTQTVLLNSTNKVSCFPDFFFFLYVEISPLKTILSLLIGKPKDAGSGVLLQPRHSLSGNNTDWHLPKPCFELTVAVAWAWYSIWSWRKLQFVSSHGYWCTKNSIVGECSGTLVQNLFRELPNCKCLDTK